jgi:hypothetical protein
LNKKNGSDGLRFEAREKEAERYGFGVTFGQKTSGGVVAMLRHKASADIEHLGRMYLEDVRVFEVLKGSMWGLWGHFDILVFRGRGRTEDIDLRCSRFQCLVQTPWYYSLKA